MGTGLETALSRPRYISVHGIYWSVIHSESLIVNVVSCNSIITSNSRVISGNGTKKSILLTINKVKTDNFNANYFFLFIHLHTNPVSRSTLHSTFIMCFIVMKLCTVYVLID